MFAGNLVIREAAYLNLFGHPPSKRACDYVRVAHHTLGPSLGGLRLVSTREFRAGISQEVTRLLADLNGENVALFDVRDTPSVPIGGENEVQPKRVPGSSADLVRYMNENFSRVDREHVQAHPTLDRKSVV